ncbi:PAS domain-containing sensor histidine kinase [Geopsychrobacter electrodiphilus]|uniref:PAS domain-containing sensor histidine kinase n=1 Tax=Geopsychrobacter electrodiphilus TaxID=225196 RepID=UPI00037DDC7F|nr:PAS domain-containing sensor histidine kinase [Geopsychrobacter electrodiphilus]
MEIQEDVSVKTQRKKPAEQIALELKVAELSRALEEIEASRNSYAFLYDFAPVGYFTFDRAGGIRAANQTGAALLGLKCGELIGQKFEHFVDYEDCLVFADFIETVFISQKKETCRLQLAQEGPLPLSVRIEALVTESGTECLAVLVDISEKKRAEQALSQSEYNLAKAQAMTHVGSWSFDPATSEVRASAELLRIMRLRPEETTDEAFSRVVHPDDRDNVLEHLRRGAEFGKNYEIEHRLQFDDGTLRWVYTIVEASVNSAGKVVKLYGTTQDITPRKQAESELRNKTNELQAIFDSIGDGIAVYDHTGMIQHHNLISPQLFPQEILPGKFCAEVFHPDKNHMPQLCPVELALKGERVDSCLALEREGQETRQLEITATPIKDAQGEHNRALVFFRDVTAKRQQELHLIQTEKMSSIGVLATGIAHEINNPLTSVAGFAEALQRRFREEPKLKEDLRLSDFPRYLEVIVRESYRCKGIIDHLLSFGRKSDGGPVKVEINIVLEEILELLKYLPGYQKIQVITRMSPDLPPVLGDPSGLRQVFMNLLVNAYHAIDGPGLVEVTTEPRDNEMIAVLVRDTGCGMAPNILERIWEPFFTTKEVGKGVGLGLALTYNIVKRYGGEIRLESKLGEGSQFTVLLPVWQGDRG